MVVLFSRRFRIASLCGLCFAAVALPTLADEIRLKDGKKLYGVIVSYEENMFKVKTDFGYVLVEKDKIASIIPTAPASSEAQSTAAQPTAKGSAEPTKGRPGGQAKPETAIASVTDPIPSTTNASVKVATPSAGKQSKIDKTGGKISGIPIKPEPPGTAPVPDPAAPALKGSSAAANSTLPAAAALPAQPKEREVPAIREDVQGNLYTNYTHGFRMYKAPSWRLIDDARKALPNAIVAM